MKYGADRIIPSLSRAVNKGEKKRARAQERRAARREIREFTR